MTSQPLNDYTWQSLRAYIERRIAGCQDSLDRLGTLGKDEAGAVMEVVHRELELLNRCLLVVAEVEYRKEMQLVRPILSLDLIRLACRGCPDFAWIQPRGEGLYRLERIGPGDTNSIETIWVFDGEIGQVVEKAVDLVKELCIGADR